MVAGRRRGPPPQPTQLRVITGNPGKRPINEDEPKPETGHLDMPELLVEATGDRGRIAREEWKRVTPLLAKARMTAKLDSPIVAAYCIEWGTYVEASEAILEKGPIVRTTTSGYMIQNPYFAIQKAALRNWTMLAQEIGIGPASRSRLKAEMPEDEADEQGILNN